MKVKNLFKAYELLPASGQMAMASNRFCSRWNACEDEKISNRTAYRWLIAMEEMNFASRLAKDGEYRFYRREGMIVPGAMSKETAIRLVLTRHPPQSIQCLISNCLVSENGAIDTAEGVVRNSTELRRLKEKIRFGPVASGLPIERPNEEVISHILDSVRRGTWLDITYKSHRGERIHTGLRVRGLVAEEGRAYLFASTGFEAEIQRFALSRIIGASTQAAAINQRLDEDPIGIDEYLGGDLTRHQTKIVLLLDEQGIDQVWECPLVMNQTVKFWNDGRYRLIGNICNEALFLSFVLGLGSSAEVLEPKELRRKVAETLLHSAARYQS